MKFLSCCVLKLIVRLRRRLATCIRLRPVRSRGLWVVAVKVATVRVMAVRSWTTGAGRFAVPGLKMYVGADCDYVAY